MAPLIALGLGLAIVMIFIGLAMPRRADPVQARLTQYGSRVRTLEEIELDRPFSERAIKPLLQSMARMVLRFAPRANLDGMRLKLEMAGNPNNWSAADFTGVRGFAALVCALIPFV